MTCLIADMAEGAGGGIYNSNVRKPFKVGNVNLNYIFKMCRDNSKQR